MVVYCQQKKSKSQKEGEKISLKEKRRNNESKKKDTGMCFACCGFLFDLDRICSERRSDIDPGDGDTAAKPASE
jgi:hypothetical protein